MITLARRVIGFIQIMILCACFLGAAAAVYCVFRNDWRRRQRAIIVLQRRLARMALQTLGLRYQFQPPSEVQHIVTLECAQGTSELIVANHLSYLDILLLIAWRSMVFVTSTDVRDTPGLGWIAKLGGCIFVDRRDRREIGQQIEQIRRLLKEGFSVAFFPEATSTNGDRLLPFKNSLFAAIEGLGPQHRVRPVFIRYESVDGRPLSPANEWLVHWYGSMTFVPHLWRLCGTRSIRASLSILPSLIPGQDGERKALAQIAERRIARAATRPWACNSQGDTFGSCDKHTVLRPQTC